MKPPSGFYDEARLGKNSSTVWISSISVILTTLYCITGAFSGIVASINGFMGGVWNPDYFNQGSPDVWKYYWSVFYDWIPSSVLGLIGLYFVQTKLRQRPFLKLLTSAKKFRFKRLFAAAGLFLILKIIAIFIQSLYLGNADVPVWSDPQAIPGFQIERTNLPVLVFCIIAPFLLVLLVLQAVFQEALFRGFIDQGLTYRFKQTLPAFIVSAALFSLWHIWNYETYYGATAFFIGLFITAFAMSIISANDEGLEAAIGIQIIWNIMGNLGIGTTIITLPTTTLWTWGEPKFNAASVFENLALCLAVIFILKFWKQGLSLKDGGK